MLPPLQWGYLPFRPMSGKGEEGGVSCNASNAAGCFPEILPPIYPPHPTLTRSLKNLAVLLTMLPMTSFAGCSLAHASDKRRSPSCCRNTRRACAQGKRGGCARGEGGEEEERRSPSCCRKKRRVCTQGRKGGGGRGEAKHFLDKSPC